MLTPIRWVRFGSRRHFHTAHIRRWAVVAAEEGVAAEVPVGPIVGRHYGRVG
jgi:hypothetical protein